MTSSYERLSIHEVNELSAEDFVKIFGNTVEHGALCASAVYGCRPFSSFEDIRGRYEEFLNQLKRPGKAGVIRLFQDLAGKLAHNDLSSESKRERASAGLHNITPEEYRKMAELISKYKEKFDFPFVICARENKKEAIMKGLEQRLENTVDVEIDNGLKEIMKICTLRLRDLISDSPQSKL